jgi:16S rRNA (uracil1498-N3)-methyltransferase
MHRFHLPPDQCHGPTLVLRGSEAHHASRVLRIQPGERVTVLDGAGQVCLCKVRDVSRQTVELALIEKRVVPPLPCQLTLLQAIPKGKIFESIIEKATELGVHRIVPLLTERVTTRLDDDRAAEKTTKWQHVAIEAIKQCGAAWLPEVTDPMHPGKYLAGGAAVELPLLASLQEDRRHPRRWFEQFAAQHGRLPSSVSIWIGPEGDFTPAEVRLILDSGARPVSLGPLVLRAETAALAAVAVIQHELRAGLG